MKVYKTKIARLAATFFFVGYLKPAPGTLGSVVAVPAALFLWKYVGAAAYIVVTVLIGAAGYWASATVLTDIAAAEAGDKPEDPSYIIIDEVAGLLIASFLPFSFLQILIPLPLLALACLAAFRFFDIIKPFNIGWIDKNIKGAAGVMLDDAAAGLYAGITVTLLFLAAA
jgi:phosphatidylglycerophosphatase A